MSQAPAPFDPYQKIPTHIDDEIDLREFWAKIVAGKWWVVVCMILFGGGAAGWALHKPNIYESKAVLAPAIEQSGGGLSALATQFGGLANLAGVTLPAGQAGSTTIALEILQSRVFLTQFIRKHQLEVPLMAAKSWDRVANELIIHEGLYDVENQRWVREVKSSKTPGPNDWALYKALKGILKVKQDKQTGLVTVAIEHVSPFLAQQWVDWLVKDLNAYMRQKDVEDAQKQIDFLKAELAKTQLAELQKVFYSLIEQNTRTIMLANVRDEYAFKTLDPAVVPEEKIKPKRALIAALGSMLGAMLGIFIALIRSRPE